MYIKLNSLNALTHLNIEVRISLSFFVQNVANKVMFPSRLTPAYLFVMGVNEVAIKYALANTVFSPSIIDHITCEKYWWRNALYINSFFPRTEMVKSWLQHFPCVFSVPLFHFYNKTVQLKQCFIS